MIPQPKTYLGDGAYAEADSWAVTLFTATGAEAPRSNEIVLDPQNIDSLFRFLQRALNVKITVQAISYPQDPPAVYAPPTPPESQW